MKSQWLRVSLDELFGSQCTLKSPPVGVSLSEGQPGDDGIQRFQVVICSCCRLAIFTLCHLVELAVTLSSSLPVEQSQTAGVL